MASPWGWRLAARARSGWGVPTLSQPCPNPVPTLSQPCPNGFTLGGNAPLEAQKNQHLARYHKVGTEVAYKAGVVTQPLPIVPNKTYMLTRRCVGRHRWLTPGTRLNQLFLYLFALGVQRFGLEVHALVVMSTHYHAIVTDPEGVIPAFEQWLHSLLARAVNRLRERSDTFWGARRGGRIEIADALALRDALVYVWNNPTKAGLVRRGKDWPGVRTTPQHMLAGVGSREPLVIDRPDELFDGVGSMPETVELAFSVPGMLLRNQAWYPDIDALASEESGSRIEAERILDPTTEVVAGSDAELKRRVGRVVGRLNELVRRAEDKVAAAFAAAGRRFVGAGAVEGQSPDETSKEPERHGVKNTRVPIFLCSDPDVRDALYAALGRWRGRYEKARQALAEYLAEMSSSGDPDVALSEDQEVPRPPLFPWGTYQLRLWVGVPCHAAPD